MERFSRQLVRTLKMPVIKDFKKAKAKKQRKLKRHDNQMPNAICEHWLDPGFKKRIAMKNYWRATKEIQI